MPRSIAVLCLAAAVTIVATPIPSRAAQSAAPPQAAIPPFSQDRPVVEINLRKIGFSGLNEGTYNMAGATQWGTLGFASDHSLVLAWMTRNNSGVSPQAGAAPAIMARLHVSFIDAVTGDETKKQEWPAPSFAVGYSLLGDGRFLVGIDRKIRLYSADFQLLREIESPAPNYEGGWMTSWNKKSILISYLSGAPQQSRLLDTESLSVISAWTEEQWTYITGFSDHWLSGSCGKQRQICLRPVDGKWQPFPFPFPLPKTGSTRGMPGVAYLLSDDTVLMLRGNEMELTSVSGAVLFGAKLQLPRFFDTNRITASNGGERFAIMESRPLGINEVLDLAPDDSKVGVLVYDVAKRSAIFRVKVKGSRDWPWTDWHTYNFALSPDGAFLAVVTDDVLRVYKLPLTQ